MTLATVAYDANGNTLTDASRKVWQSVPPADNSSTEDEIGIKCLELIRALKAE